MRRPPWIVLTSFAWAAPTRVDGSLPAHRPLDWDVPDPPPPDPPPEKEPLVAVPGLALLVARRRPPIHEAPWSSPSNV